MKLKKGSRVLITGFNGLLGDAVVRLLREKQIEVICIGNPISKLGKNYDVIQIDLASEWNMAKLPSHVDAIFHFAQSSQFRNVPERALDVFNVNVRTTAMLLDYGYRVGIENFVYTSTGGVYTPSKEKRSETSSLVEYGDLGFYLGSKASSEIIVNAYRENFQTQIYRPFFIYGDRQKPSMLLPRLFNNVLNGQPTVLSGPNGISINPIHAKDAARAILSGANHEKSLLVNLAGPQILSLRQICEMFGRYLNLDPKFKIEESVPNHLVADTSSMQNINYGPQIRLENSIPEIETAARRV